MNETDDLFVVS